MEMIYQKIDFCTAAINPSVKPSDDNIVHQQDYLVHQLPQALENLKVSYGTLESTSLRNHIKEKIKIFRIHSLDNHHTLMPLEEFAQDMLTESIFNAQDFCERYLGESFINV
jgi:hypothetical protein